MLATVIWKNRRCGYRGLYENASSKFLKYSLPSVTELQYRWLPVAILEYERIHRESYGAGMDISYREIIPDVFQLSQRDDGLWVISTAFW